MSFEINSNAHFERFSAHFSTHSAQKRDDERHSHYTFCYKSLFLRLNKRSAQFQRNRSESLGVSRCLFAPIDVNEHRFAQNRRINFQELNTLTQQNVVLFFCFAILVRFLSCDPIDSTFLWAQFSLYCASFCHNLCCAKANALILCVHGLKFSGKSSIWLPNRFRNVAPIAGAIKNCHRQNSERRQTHVDDVSNSHPLISSQFRRIIKPRSPQNKFEMLAISKYHKL